MDKTPDFLVTLSFAKDNVAHVTVAFTTAVGAQSKGHSAAVLLLVDGVHVGRKGYVDDIDVGPPFRPVKELMDEFFQNGGSLQACAA